MGLSLRALTSILAGVSVLGVSHCGASRDETATCSSVCEDLAACAFLPSALGAGSEREDNCVERCNNTQSSDDARKTFDDVIACHNEAFEGDPEARWCGEDGVASPCLQFRTCLLQKFENSALVGQAEASLLVQSEARSRGGAGGESGSCADEDVESCLSCPKRNTELVEDSACAEVSHLIVLPLAQNPAGVIQDCGTLLRSAVELKPVVTGVYQPGVKAMYLTQNGPAKDDKCRVISGGDQLASAGESTQFVIEIPPRLFDITDLLISGCESEELCTNQIDDDKDGMSDCEDVMCTKWCVENGISQSPPGAAGGAGGAGNGN